MVKDKNGIEIRIGDRVHYKRPETRSRFGFMLPARDMIFTVEEFITSPFVKHGGHDSRMSENKLWINGPELELISSSRNSISPLAVVKINTLSISRRIPSHSFISPLSGHITP